MRKLLPLLTVLCLFDVSAPFSTGQTTAPTPTTTPTTRHALVVPPGFLKIQVGSRVALVEPADEAWVRESLQTVPPSTRPSTTPADLLERLKDCREALRARLGEDLGITDAATINKFLDQTLAPAISRVARAQPPLIYMVTSHDKLKQLVKGGWSDPRFYYNRVADDVQYSPAVNLNPDAEQADDVLLPVVYNAGDDREKTRKDLETLVHGAETTLPQSIADRAIASAQLAFVAFIGEQVVAPLKLSADQDWFGVGLAGTLSTRYVCELAGVGFDERIKALTADVRGNPIRAATIDLLHPLAIADMRREAAPFYADAFRRKSTRVVAGWIEKVGSASVARTLSAVSKNKPADGAGLVALIKQTSGVDLSAELGKS